MGEKRGREWERERREGKRVGEGKERREVVNRSIGEK